MIFPKTMAEQQLDNEIAALTKLLQMPLAHWERRLANLAGAGLRQWQN